MRICAALLALLALAACDKGPTDSTIDVAPYGKVHVIRQQNGPHRDAVVMFSGAKGWTGQLTSRAMGVSWPDRIVIGIDTPTYLRNLKPSTHEGTACLDYTAALPPLLRRVAEPLHDPVDPAPLLIGADDGGTIALTAAAQSQPQTIEGVIAEDFCPRLTAPLPPCAGPGPVEVQAAADGNGNVLVAPKALQAPFVAIADPKQCTATDVRAFTSAMADGRTVAPVPGQEIDLLISVATQTGANLARIPAVSDSDLADLPLIEVPGAPGRDDRLAIVMTGDGGWAALDKSIAENLAARGVGVVGFSTLKYYWKPQTADDSAEDLERVIRHYMQAWNRKRVVLVGYSFGAGVLPFLIAKLPEDLRQSITLVTLLAPPAHADFEIKVGGWIGQDANDGPEVAPTLPGLTQPILCIRSEEEDDSPCPATDTSNITSVVLKGDHHFDGAYAGIAKRILDKSAAP